MGVGALAGLAGYGAGMAAMGAFAAPGTIGATVVQGGAISGIASGASSGAAIGMVNGSGHAWINGASFWEGMAEGGKQAAFGAATGAVTGGAINGVTSWIKGNNFWTGVAVKPPLAPNAPATTVNKNPSDPNNPVPDRVSRVVPGNADTSPEASIGLPEADRVFVTAPEDIQGLNAREIVDKLELGFDPAATNGVKVIEMPTPDGIASPLHHNSPQFRGGGLTSGGAREFTVPNVHINELPKDPKMQMVF